MSMSSPQDFENFGPYVFLKRLATGGMAEVFLARPANQAGNGRIQVIKRLLPHVANNSMFLNMFQTEIQVILGFNHPHVVQLHDFGELNNRSYIAMEYLEGKSLKEVMLKFIKNQKSLPVPMALGLVAQAASGLNYAHTFVNKVTGEAMNAVHRDISPHNLIVSYDGNLKVIDFGIAKVTSGLCNEPTSVGTIKGKISYLSPEQIGGLPIDARSDVFSLGIVAWELLTLHRPFTKDGDTDISIISRINNCDDYIVPPSWFNPEVPAEIDAVILKALKKDPQDRYASASEFQIAIRKVMLQYFSHYSYSDTAQIMTSLFEEEITGERTELRELNIHAQEAINQSADSATIVLDKPGVVTGVFNGIRAAVPGLDHVDQRLIKIENMIRQKFSLRHYLMLGFYIMSILLIKMDYRFPLLNLAAAPKKPALSKMLSPNIAAPKTVSGKPVKHPQARNNGPKKRAVASK